MNLSDFSKEQLIIIEKLLEISNIINELYEQLYYLEITNKKNTTEYNKTLEKLKEKINIENIIYQNTNLTTKQKFKIIELLSKNSKTDNITSIINQNEYHKSTRRIINALINQTITNINHKESSIELLKKIGININDTKTSTEINNYSKIELAINNDIILVFITLLKENSSLFKYSHYQKELTKALYSTIFINKNIEKYIIDNNFNIDNNIYISSPLINDLLKTNSKTYNKILNIIVENQIRTHIINHLEIKDTDYNDNKKNISSIIRECYIRTLLTFITEKKLNQLNTEFNNLIQNSTYKIQFHNNRISENTILNCFKNVKYDKAKKRIISLNRNTIN